MSKKTKCPVCHSSKAILNRRCKRCGWKVKEDMAFYEKKGFNIQNGEIVLDAENQNKKSKKLLAPMTINVIWAIANILLGLIFALIGLLIWAWLDTSDISLGIWWSVIAFCQFLIPIGLLCRTKVGYKLNRWGNILLGVLSIGLACVSFVLGIVIGAIIFAAIAAIEVSMADYYKKNKNIFFGTVKRKLPKQNKIKSENEMAADDTAASSITTA